MSESEPNIPESAKASAGDSPSGRRISSSRPKKAAKAAKKDAGATPEPPSYPVFDLSESPAESPVTVAESASLAGTPQQEVSKRKRRRKKGKGGGSQNPAPSTFAESSAELAEESVAASVPGPAKQQQRLKVDSESVAKLAWKIYLAEVSEEGVALIGDSDAKELTRRCFRLAEIFVEEQTRRR
jgi:hypothetical protein